MTPLTTTTYKPQVHFAAKIRFVDKAEFDRVSAEQGPRSDFVGIAGPKRQGYTTYILSCSGGGITGPKSGLLFHLLAGRPEYVQKLEKHLDTFQGRTPELKGFLIGGKRDNAKSVELFKRLRKLFEDKHIPTTIIWGQSETAADRITDLSDIAYSSKGDDTWTVNARFMSPDGVKDVLTSTDLQRVFAEIDIAEGDELVLQDGIFRRGDIEKHRNWFA